MTDTEDLIALVHACGLRSGGNPAAQRTDCPFCNDRLDLCRAWLSGFSLGRLGLAARDATTPEAPSRLH